MRRFCAVVLISLFFVVGIREFVFGFYTVNGNSMFPTLEDNERIIVNKISYNIDSPKRGDVIVFQDPTDKTHFLVKRIIGMPFDVLQIKKHEVYINYHKIEEPYVHELMNEDTLEEIDIPKDRYFVMGDNRNFSKDSRNSMISFISKKQMEGKAFFVLYPWTKYREI